MSVVINVCCDLFDHNRRAVMDAAGRLRCIGVGGAAQAWRRGAPDRCAPRHSHAGGNLSGVVGGRGGGWRASSNAFVLRSWDHVYIRYGSIADKNLLRECREGITICGEVRPVVAGVRAGRRGQPRQIDVWGQ